MREMHPLLPEGSGTALAARGRMKRSSGLLRLAGAVGRMSGLVVTALAVLRQLALPGPAPTE